MCTLYLFVAMEGRCSSAAIVVVLLLGFQASFLNAAPQFTTKQPQNRQPVVLSSQVFRTEPQRLQPTFSSPQAQIIFSQPAKQTISPPRQPNQVSVTSRGNTPQTQFNSPAKFPASQETVAPQGVRKPVILQRFSSNVDSQTIVSIPSPVRQQNNVNAPQVQSFQSVQAPQVNTFKVVQNFQAQTPQAQPQVQKSQVLQRPLVQNVQSSQVRTPEVHVLQPQLTQRPQTRTSQVVQTPQTQTFEIVQTPQEPSPQTRKSPKIQTSPKPQTHTFEIVQTPQEPSSKTRTSPTIHTSPKPQTQTFEIVQTPQEPTPQTRTSPKIQTSPKSQTQTFEIVQTPQEPTPQTRTSPKIQTSPKPQKQKFEIVQTPQEPIPQTRTSPKIQTSPKPQTQTFEIVQTPQEPSPKTRTSPAVQTTEIPTSTVPPTTTIKTPFKPFLRIQKKKRPDFRVELSTSKSPVRMRIQETESIVSRPLEIHEEQTPVSFKRPVQKPAEPTRAPQEEEEEDLDIGDEDENEREKQIYDAQYSFRSEVNDPLSDSNIVREEKRENGAVEGMYSYSDGFFRRTVRYRADHLGYRVLREDVEPLGDGPKPDPKGHAQVAVMSTSGVSSHYTVSASDITDPRTALKEEKEEEEH